MMDGILRMARRAHSFVRSMISGIQTQTEPGEGRD